MKNHAETFISKNSVHFAKSSQHLGYECSYSEIDNNQLIELLSESCNYEETILSQDCYSFSDGSYITRNEESYFIDDDIADFRVTEQMQVQVNDASPTS